MQNLANLSSLHLEIIEKKAKTTTLDVHRQFTMRTKTNDNQDNIDNKNNTIGMCTPNHFSIRQ